MPSPSSPVAEMECPSCCARTVICTGARVSTYFWETVRFYCCAECGHEWKEKPFSRRYQKKKAS